MIVWGSPPLLFRVRTLFWLAVVGAVSVTCRLTGLSVLPFISLMVGVACLPCRASHRHEGVLQVRWLFWVVEFASTDLDGMVLRCSRVWWPLQWWELATRARGSGKLSIFGNQSELKALAGSFGEPVISAETLVLARRGSSGAPLILVVFGVLFVGLVGGYLGIVATGR